MGHAYKIILLGKVSLKTTMLSNHPQVQIPKKNITIFVNMNKYLDKKVMLKQKINILILKFAEMKM